MLTENPTGFVLQLDDVITFGDGSTATVEDLLKEKHPAGKPANESVLLDGDCSQVNNIRFEELTPDLLWSVKACPADHPGRFSVFALLLIVTPPNLQNHLALASEGYLNNQCFGSSSRNVAVGGEVREKHNPEMSVCNGDSTSGRCRRTQT